MGADCLSEKNKGDVTQVPADGQMTDHMRNAQSALASPSPMDSVAETGTKVNRNLGQGENPAVSADGGQSPEDENPVGPDQIPVSTNFLEGVYLCSSCVVALFFANL